MRTFKTSEAASHLNVSSNTLRMWERKFGFPSPQRSSGRQRYYSQAEILALSAALDQGLAISSAISVARDAPGADLHTLVRALTSLQAGRADRAMDGSLALRSVEQSVEELLLPALDSIRQRVGGDSALLAFADAWSQDWLLRARRLAANEPYRGAVLIGDATGPSPDPARAYVLALSLCCTRAGFDSIVLPTAASGHLRAVVGKLQPSVIVIGGCHVSDDEVARWAYAVARPARLPVALYHRRLGSAAGSHTLVLPASPVQALDAIGELAAQTEELVPK